MKIFLFDFDGTLVDSMPTYVSAMLRILDENDVAYSDDIVKIITPLGLKGTADYFISLGFPKTKGELIQIMGEYMLDAYENTIQAKSNVIDTLHRLRAGGARLNVLTASPHETLDPCLKRLQMYDLFENVWSCEDFSTTKADPRIYQMVADCLNAPVEDILFLDDNLNADKTAKAAGMQVCGVYDDSSKEYTEEIRQVSDYYIYDFSELPDMFGYESGMQYR